MKKLLLLSLLVAIGFTAFCGKTAKTKVLTLGTIHNGHSTSKYSYADMMAAVAAFKPDLICVEIRPQEFRTEPYLREMMLATAYGDINKIAVAPIDWWDDKNDDRAERDSLGKLEAYQLLIKKADSLEQNSELLKNFSSKYGNPYQNKELDINFWNGQEYNNVNRENYRISISVFGDSPFNLHAVTRNAKMCSNIKASIAKYKAKRVVVLTGGEHKSFVDDAFANEEHCEVVQLNQLGQLPKFDFANLLEKESPKLYYTNVDSAKIGQYYSYALLPLVHGMNMDLNFKIINLANLPLVKITLDKWSKDLPTCSRISYEWGWYHFLNGSYDEAIKCCKEDLASDAKNKDFPNYFNLRTIGFCYDLKGDRTNALAYYQQVREQLLKEKRTDKQIKKFLLNTEEQPLTR